MPDWPSVAVPVQLRWGLRRRRGREFAAKVYSRSRRFLRQGRFVNAIVLYLHCRRPRLTIGPSVLDIGTVWTPSKPLPTSSALSESSQCRTPDRSAGATSRLRIGGTTKGSRIARGFVFGSSTGFAAAREYVNTSTRGKGEPDLLGMDVRKGEEESC